MNARHLPILAIALLLGACSSLSGNSPVAPAASSKPAKTSNPADMALYARLSAASQGAAVIAAVDEGSSETELLLADKYSSASGKQCVSAVEVSAGTRHVLCRNNGGEINHIRLGSR